MAPHRAPRLAVAVLGLGLAAAPLPALADTSRPASSSPASSSPASSSPDTSSPAPGEATQSPSPSASTTPGSASVAAHPVSAAPTPPPRTSTTSIPTTASARPAPAPASPASSTPRIAAAALAAPTIAMGRPAWSGSTMKGTPVSGRISPTRSGVAVRLSVWRYIPAEKVSRWSYSTSVPTRADGTFSARLDHNRGGVVTQLWRAEATLGSPARVVATSFTESKLAMIDLTTGPVTAAMVPLTYHAGCPVTPSMLTKVSMNFFGFDGRIHSGHLIVRSTDVARIRSVFTASFTAHFPMRVMQDPSIYRTDDNSMAADNTYGYFCRQVNGNPYALSPHSSGHAVDVNTVENPYQKPNGSWYPVNGRAYVDRSKRRPGMLFADSVMTRSFLANGYRWLSGFDWQHFQVR